MIVIYYFDVIIIRSETKCKPGLVFYCCLLLILRINHFNIFQVPCVCANVRNYYIIYPINVICT